MLCWSCGKEIPDRAKRCHYCEAEVEPEPTEEEIQAIGELLGSMAPEALDELRDAFQKSKSGEEFANRIMVGDCPACGSSNTSDCASDPDIEDICVGRCIDCGQLWCLDCGEFLSADEPTCPECDFAEALDDEFSPEDTARLRRDHLLAAETFGYSFANYRDHLGIGNVRFERLMPEDARTLERADREGWPDSKVAEVLEVDVEQARILRRSCREAVEVVDAKNAAESFRKSVRFVIQHAVERGLKGRDSIEQLVTQICYRVSDLAVLLEMEGQSLSRYSRALRREPQDEDDED